MNENKENMKGTMENMKDTLQESANNIQTKTKETMDYIQDQTQQTINKAQETINQYLNMNRLISQALFILKEQFDPQLEPEKQIPSKILSDAKAIVFLSVVKGGIGISGIIGTGIMLARTDNDNFSGPLAIALAGIDIGLNIGVEKSVHMIILRDDAAVRIFQTSGQLQLGVDVSLAAGPLGRDTSFALNIGEKDYVTTFSYSRAQGAFIGVSFEGQIIVIRNECNEQYYGTKVDSKDIIERRVEPIMNPLLAEIYDLLNQYAIKKPNSSDQTEL